MKDTPSAAFTVAASSAATGILDATGGSVVFVAVSADEGASVLVFMHDFMYHIT